ncbi:hypothetical protein AZI85_15240 [Bdellovibrio bacteriovorus]|uniref:DNA helicase n=1 Tax=Bdellovibrio bacteriovorus TaxID=959 RepID=A0A150WU89_BDEBC|nr:AAA domain-containing protein [Bdellovibrio bacteriovorus]KYG70045.1 hypothetical protein AZI85_15240 [Bdellovibrio bacteriovorus]
MKPTTKIELEAVIRMIHSEERAEYARHRFEIDSPLSHICESADALGPLVFKEKCGLLSWKLCGDAFYSRFRPGDRVDIRTKVFNADASVKFSNGWKVDAVAYPSPGKIEVTISGAHLIDAGDIGEVFLFKSSSSIFKHILIRKLREMPRSGSPILLNTGEYKISADNPKFKELYNDLNDSQKIAVHSLIENNLSGAIQGPPGTGKTHLLRAVIALALNSNMKVCVTSFTHAAVDNLLAKVVQDGCAEDWVRVGNSDKIRKEHYRRNLDQEDFIAPGFSEDLNENNLFGCTLHQLAFSSRTAPKFDLMVIDEAGQVPLYFWPFIQRAAKRLVLVGDQFQLPPVLSSSHDRLPFDDVFSLFTTQDMPMLETQYRMRREIQSWSSEKFYRGKLLPHVSVANRDYFSDSTAFVSDGFVVPKKFKPSTSDRYSQQEANFIVDKIERLLRVKENPKNVGVICPYRVQAGVVNASLQSRFGVAVASQVLVDTVERFQGQEREAIFLSLGSSGNSKEDLRFLSDPRRLNVSVTRAKSRFFCLFDERMLARSTSAQSGDLNEFLRWVTYGRAKIKRAA